MAKLDLSVIILSWNTKQILHDCLASIFQHEQQPGYEVIVVDNASEDGSAEMVRQQFPQVNLIVNQENVGFAKGNNQAAEQAKGEFLLLLNSDTVLIRPLFGQLVSFARSVQAGAVGPKLLNADHSLQPSAGWLPSLLSVVSQVGLPIHRLGFSHWPVLQSNAAAYYQTPHPVGWVSGACLLTPTQLYRQLGGLDEQIFMYMEEVDYCARVQQAGKQVWLDPEVELIHLKEQSSPDGRRYAIIKLHQGLYYYFAKHKSASQLFFVWLILLLGAVLRLWKAPATYLSVLKINPWRPFG